MRLTLSLFCFITTFLYAQNDYPQDYFHTPLEVPLILSGTFGELRSNHFHSGIDIKTQQRVGLKVNASASGFVSRIKVSHYGYGKALYITHPNGYTTVYAHLLKFSPEIETYVKKHQYKKESYEIELFPTAGTLPVTQGNIVGYSGNSGGSGGPHLHFEIRDKVERPMNPMLFGINIKDNIRPIVKSIYAYPLNEKSSVNKSNEKQKLRLIPLKNGNYTVENIEAYGKIAFGIVTFDRQNYAANSNGVYNIQTTVNGTKNFELDFKRFSFNESKHINRLIDYEHYSKRKERIQKLYKNDNPLSLFNPSLNNNILNIKDSTSTVYKIKISDYKDNASIITVNIKGQKPSTIKQKTVKITPYYILANQKMTLKEGNVSVAIPNNTFYENFHIDFEVKNDTLRLHKNVVPAKKRFSITYDISNYKSKNNDRLYIARLIGTKKQPVYTSTERIGNTLVGKSKILGTYALAIDTIKPTIKAANFKNKQWLSNYRYLKIKIEDKHSGVSKYRATVNGKWILMEYDYKTKMLVHDFNDKTILDSKNNLKVIVTDNVGNNSTFETLFYRK